MSTNTSKWVRYVHMVSGAVALLAASFWSTAAADGKQPTHAPRFEVDASWPKTLPNN